MSNLMSLDFMLRAKQHELQQLTNTSNTNLHQLEKKTQGNIQLTEEKEKLQLLYDKSLKTAEEYRHELMTSIKTNQDINTLTDLLSKRKETLDKHEKQIIVMDRIREMHMMYRIGPWDWTLYSNIHTFFDFFSKQKEKILTQMQHIT